MENISSFIQTKSFQRIDEAQLFINYGKHLDSVMYKFKCYANNNINNRINENSKIDLFTIEESYAITNVVINVLEEYKQNLLEEQNIYEQYLNGTLSIEEGLFDDLYNSAKNTIKKGVKAVGNGLKEVKTKIEDLTQLIKDLLTNGIKSIKDFGQRLLKILEKFKIPTISELAEKIGIKPKTIEKEFLTNNEAVIKNINDLKKDEFYESLGKEINNKLILEEEGSTVVSQGEKKSWKDKLKKMFLGFVKWFGLCVVLPGTICFLFPGTYIALLVPIVVKILWNGYSIVKIYKQIKEIKQKWPTMKKVEKIVSCCALILTICLTVWNFVTSLDGVGEIFKGWIDNGCKLFVNANLGIQPDVLTRGFAAILDTIKKGELSFEGFSESFAAISNSFNKITEDVTDLAKELGMDAQEVLKKLADKEFTNSIKFIEAAQKLGLKPDVINELPDDAMLTILANGHFDKTANDWSKRAVENGAKLITNNLDKSLNLANDAAGSMAAVEMTVSAYKEMMKSGIELGYQGFHAVVSVAGEVVKSVVTAAVSMAATLPFIDYTPSDGVGFRIRLGEEGSDNYVYEIGENGIKTEDFDDDEKIKQMADSAEEFNKILINNAKTKEEKEKIEENFKKFKEQFKKDIKDIKRVVFYGTRVKEDKEKNESLSYIPFTEYIFEKKEYNIKNPDKETIFKNLQDLRKFIESFCKPYTKETDANGKKLIKKADTTLAGSTQIILRSLFSTSEKNKTSKFEFDKDFDDTEDSKKSIRKRALTKETTDDKFGPKDIYTLAVFLNKHAFDDCSVDDINEALIDVVLIKNQLNKSSDVSDRIKMLYINIVKNLSKSDKFKEKIADEWKPGKNWAPLNFDIDDIDDSTKKEVKKAENNLLPTEEEKEEVEEKVDDQDKTEDKKEEDKKEDDKQETEEDDEEIAVLEFVPFFNCWDIADANKKGPREEPYSFKGCFINLEFIPIEGGASQNKIEKVLGELLHNMVNNCYNLMPDKPCIKEEGSKKFKVNENSLFKPEQEREELANFSNKDLTDILNNPKNAYKYISMLNGKITLAKSKKEKEQLKELEKINNEKLKNNKELQKIRPDLYDKNGKLKEKEWKDFNKGLSNYQLGQEKSKKSKGFFSNLWDNIKSLFGVSTDEYKKADELLKKDKKTNESVEEVFKKPISLTAYLKENLN